MENPASASSLPSEQLPRVASGLDSGFAPTIQPDRLHVLRQPLISSCPRLLPRLPFPLQRSLDLSLRSTQTTC
uniref:Uncharacterized protein n=1 Tax=Globisporangium ultimum (strain ATCC 200006 / CBS 805.95 / DAOM BR144) TaxID=431595 RepID=K3XD93_GLOUD